MLGGHSTSYALVRTGGECYGDRMMRARASASGYYMAFALIITVRTHPRFIPRCCSQAALTPWERNVSKNALALIDRPGSAPALFPVSRYCVIITIWPFRNCHVMPLSCTGVKRHQRFSTLPPPPNPRRPRGMSRMTLSLWALPSCPEHVLLDCPVDETQPRMDSIQSCSESLLG